MTQKYYLYNDYYLDYLEYISGGSIGGKHCYNLYIIYYSKFFQVLIFSIIFLHLSF